MRFYALPVIVLSLMALALAGVAGCSDETEARPGGAGGAGGGQQREPIPVTLAPVVTRPVQRSVNVVGTLYGDEEATISAKVPGRITTILKDVGDRCGPGEPLAQIEKMDYELARAQHRMAVQESLAKLGLSEFPAGEFDPANVPLVERAKLQAHNAQAKFRRGEQLFKEPTPLISEQDFADLKTAYDVARSDYDVQLLTARSILAEAATRRSELDLAEQRLADTTVRAPAADETESSAVDAATTHAAAGRYAVAQRFVSVGEYVREGTPMFRLVASDPIKFRAKVPERFVSQVRVGQKARVTVEAYADVFEGVVARINPAVDLASRTFEVEVIVPNSDGRLQPGAFARGSILTITDENVVFVPKQAVVTFAGVSKVFTVADGKAVDHTVRPTDVEIDAHVEIAQGLDPGGEVVVEGAARLAGGAPVIVTPATRPAPAAAAAASSP
ncbi:MAG TPA: efflux RND transporter periplasmic adaptor subunit [Tepidisphaeraceae bacterium]|nr:efflux RND transporter periplasmic adaptor subunit [Tepidisphaeraceae bacterium]